MTNSRASSGGHPVDSDLEINATKSIILDKDGSSHSLLTENANDSIHLKVGGEIAIHAYELGTEVSVGIGAENVLATNGNNGHLMIPSCAGVPTGTPTAFTGKVALIFDVTNNDLYVYDGSWIKINA